MILEVVMKLFLLTRLKVLFIIFYHFFGINYCIYDDKNKTEFIFDILYPNYFM
jgi:hypothetical protein